MNQFYKVIKNNSSPVNTQGIPVLEYGKFYDLVASLLKSEANHCLNYFSAEGLENIKFYCCIANDTDNSVSVFSHILKSADSELKSLTPVCPQLHIFEREIHERTGIDFTGHPWLKPVRYSYDRSDRSRTMNNYPFYEIESEELHEVGVGPVHAGIIEPGHFRFICNGEKVLHLEIQLGYQHRGVESLFLKTNNALQRSILSENIAGDTSVGHALAHAQVIESLGGLELSETLQIERCIALELERIAVHIGDTAAMCGDVSYQLGQVTCEALRTTVINTTQLWCGNRFGKGLIRTGGTNFPLTDDAAGEIIKMLDDTGRRFNDVAGLIFNLPSVLSRFEDIGIVTREQSLSAGAVGMAARSSGVARDSRISHPFQYYKKYPVKPVIFNTGDVLARGLQRKEEVRESVKIITDLINIWRSLDKKSAGPVYNYLLKPDSFAISVVEGWRGAICHIGVTGNNGNIMHYRIIDPSVHNWMALALAVRNQEISDFPICNKSFNLSYCGHDL